MLALANLGLWVNGVRVGPDGVRQKESDAGKAPKNIASNLVPEQEARKRMLAAAHSLKASWTTALSWPAYQSPKHPGTTQEDSPPPMNLTPW